MKTWIAYFLNRPVIANVIMFGVIIAALVLWQRIGKEELPEFSSKWLSISVAYPGASANDVELFITKSVEEKLKGITALKTVDSTSSYGSSSFSINFEPNISNLQEKIQEVKDVVNAVDLPREAEEPVYRQFRSSEKAIIDIGIYLKGKELLDVASRVELQKYVLAFKNKILSLSEISGVKSRGYLKPELQIKVKPDLLEKYEISLNQVKNQIVSQNVRQPIGSMKDANESEISVVSELSDVESMEGVILTAGFQGQKLKLSQLAKIEQNFKQANTIIKVQGYEGIILNIIKSSNADILTAQKAVVNFIESFKKINRDLPVDFVLMDDESYDIKNRLYLISTNGLIGFILVLMVLFLFLDLRSGFWVAMGIPFALAFTLVLSSTAGFTVNNVSLAAVIIVLGIVVDDAIIMAENISRRKQGGNTNAVDSVLEVGTPILASILTTCAAFIPLYFFSGTFGIFVRYIPVIISLMLLASLLESFFILPSHMTHTSRMGNLLQKRFSSTRLAEMREELLERMESFYSRTLQTVLKYRFSVIAIFVLFLAVSGYLFYSKMNFSLFPREEARSFRLKVVAKEGTTRSEMARLVRPIEEIFLNDGRGIVTAVRTRVGQNRHGGKVEENEASIRVEIVPRSEREVALNTLLADWKKETRKFKEFKKIQFRKGWFGHAGGSPIIIEVQENSDASRKEVVGRLSKSLESMEDLTNVEVERTLKKQEYRLEIDKNEASRLGVDFEKLAGTLRAYIEGDILYTLNVGEEEVNVRFTSEDGSKDDIDKITNLTVANENNYLVPIKKLVKVVKREKPANIRRINYKRATTIYAELNRGTKKTPLEIAVDLERNVFPEILSGFPTTNLEFRGEVEDSRDSQSDFALSVGLALCIIYILLIFLFDSLLTPLLVVSIIPFGVVGTVLAFWVHGMTQYGFFGVVGTLGMIGVVVNGAIILINKLETKFKKLTFKRQDLNQHIAEISVTRLRPIFITTITTVVALFPTAYGLSGYDSMLAEMMLAMAWGLLFGMFITLVLVPCVYSIYAALKFKKRMIV